MAEQQQSIIIIIILQLERRIRSHTRSRSIVKYTLLLRSALDGTKNSDLIGSYD
jgi:hypothetical protein